MFSLGAVAATNKETDVHEPECQWSRYNIRQGSRGPLCVSWLIGWRRTIPAISPGSRFSSWRTWPSPHEWKSAHPKNKERIKNVSLIQLNVFLKYIQRDGPRPNETVLERTCAAISSEPSERNSMRRGITVGAVSGNLMQHVWSVRTNSWRYLLVSSCNVGELELPPDPSPLTRAWVLLIS